MNVSSGVIVKTCLVLMLLLSVWNPADAQADQPLELVRITCIPEMRYFEVESKDYPSKATTWIRFGFINGKEKDAKAGEKKRWRILKERGLYPPENVIYQCKLPESTYELVMVKDQSRETGECGGAPTATMTLKRNGQEWVSHVLFGNTDCFGRPTVASVAINDGKEGWGVRNMLICVKSNREGAPDTCKYLQETDEAKFIPGEEIKAMKLRGASEAEIVKALIPDSVMKMKEVPITEETIASYLKTADSERPGQP
jgi:hypothetical protein